VKIDCKEDEWFFRINNKSVPFFLFSSGTPGSDGNMERKYGNMGTKYGQNMGTPYLL
jgi:hypothetical protein